MSKEPSATYGETPDEWYEREKTAFRAWWESEGEKTFSRTPTLAAGAGWFARAEAAPETAPIVPCLAPNGCTTPEWCARNGDACRVKTPVSETGELDLSEKARLADALDDVKRLHEEKMKFFERTIELERELAAAKRQACTSEHRTTCSFAVSAIACKDERIMDLEREVLELQAQLDQSRPAALEAAASLCDEIADCTACYAAERIRELK